MAISRRRADGQADGVVDEDERHEGEQGNQHHSGHADVASQLEEATDLLLAVTNVLGHIGVFVVDLGVGVIDDLAFRTLVEGGDHTHAASIMLGSRIVHTLGIMDRQI